MTTLPLTDRDRFTSAAHLLNTQEYAQAADTLEPLVTRWPARVSVLSNLALAYKGLERHDEAVALLRRATQAAPDQGVLWYNLANALRKTDQPAQALACYEKAIQLLPTHRAARMSQANTLYDLHRFAEAEEAFQALVHEEPHDEDGWFGLSRSLRAQHRTKDLVGVCQQAVERVQGFTTEFALADALHRDGQIAASWTPYEIRLTSKASYLPTLPWPRWEGEAFAGKTLLVVAEQGLGDQVQFIRFAAQAKALGGTVIVQAPQPLQRLFASVPGVDCVIPREVFPEGIDVWIPVASLPYALNKAGHTTIPTAPYVAAEERLVGKWKQLLAGVGDLKVGLNWEGNRSNEEGRPRHLPLGALAPLARVPGVRLYALQTGPGRDQLPVHADAFGLTDLGRFSTTFADTAAVMEALDLVITNDTSVAHVAGALGRPTWVMLRHTPCWRWVEDAPGRSLWYPNCRLFRQSTPGDWAGLAGRVASALTQHAA